MLHLHPDMRQEICETYGAAGAALAKYFAQPSAADKKPKKEMALASKVARELDGLYHSSEVDCFYYACVLTGADLLDDAAFYGAMGIGRDEKTTLGGHEQDKLETLAGPVRGERDDGTCYETVQLLTKLSDDELESIDDYVDKGEQENYSGAAAVLESIGTVVGGHLCADDGASKIVFTLAETEPGTWVGLLAVRIEGHGAA